MTMGNDAQQDPKRQRLDYANQQRTTFEEDMARIRSAMNCGNNTASPAAPSAGGGGNETADYDGGEAMGEDGGGERGPGDFPGHREGVGGGVTGSHFPQQHSQRQGGESASQQQQSSGESTLQQQPARNYYHPQQQQVQQMQSLRRTTGNSERSMGGLDSEDEEDGGNNWLQNFTPRSVTRVGENYQVTALPATPSPAAPAASSSYVSPGIGDGR